MNGKQYSAMHKILAQIEVERLLIKAAALLIAEIERRDRAAQ